MAFDAETVKGVLEKADISVEDRVALLLGEYNADVSGLKANRDDFRKKNEDLKKELEVERKKVEETTGKVAGLEEELKKHSPEETKKYFETQLSLKENEWKTEKEKYGAEISRLRESHYSRLRNDAVSEAVKDLKFVDGLRDGFIARVETLHRFEPTEIDGEIKFLNKEHKNIGDVIREFALTKEGKAYIANTSTGGGAQGSDNKAGSGGTAMPVKQFEALSPAQKLEFFQKGGKLTE